MLIVNCYIEKVCSSKISEFENMATITFLLLILANTTGKRSCC